MHRKLIAAGLCFALFTIVLFLRNGNGLDAAPTTELEPFAYWAFDPQSLKDKTVADQVGKLHASNSTDLTPLNEPVPALALPSNGSGLMVREKVLANDPMLPKEAFSIVAWVRIDEPLDYGSVLNCLQDNGLKEKGFMFGFRKSKFSFALATQGADDGDGLMTYMDGKTDIKLGYWTHLAATYDGKTMRLYVNGTLDAESNAQTVPVLYADAAPLTIARYLDDNEDYITMGAIKELQWCNNAIPPDVIAKHYTKNESLVTVEPKNVGPAFVVYPYLQFATQTTMTIMCETNVATQCTIRYGTTYPSQASIKEKSVGTMHEVKLTDLKPASKYFYEVTCMDADGNPLTSGRRHEFLAPSPLEGEGWGEGEKLWNQAISF